MYNKNIPPNNRGKFLYSAMSTLSILHPFSLQREIYQRKKRQVYRSIEEQRGAGRSGERLTDQTEISRVYPVCV